MIFHLPDYFFLFSDKYFLSLAISVPAEMAFFYLQQHSCVCFILVLII
jgi:hypothetical protein